ncbi:hypothetical protein [Paenibacillus tarimensis]|uniref:hypothetical protein n=1 Tax=Paenibacillus tarimensis TaxID=416012 RepID=UPI001F33C93D|nr:hypothetical protein [Paenibacillus tarimensis]MCF2943905.1 hypothetical protein [Paenibacillus tarimensis]
MLDIMLLLHVIGTGGMGFYLLLPFLVGRTTQLTGEGQAGLAEGLVLGNRIAQYFLILQLLTGGYLISQAGEYTVAWMIIVIVLFLAIAALGGIMTKPLKGIVSSIRSGKSAAEMIKRVRTMSLIVLVIYLVILYFMQYPMYKQVV